jgi:1-acyl-sn-glycerol-3-phosphate acyltransferase
MERNPRFIRSLLVCFVPFRHLFRIEVTGLERLPDRPCLLVANHSIGAAFEIFGLLDAWERHFASRGGRAVYGLTHRLSFRVPILSSIMGRVGAIPATFESAKHWLKSSDVIVFPGGNWEVTRRFTLGNTVDFHGHRGWVWVAKESQVDIVPVAITGSYGTNPVLARSRLLAKISLFDFFLGLRWLPISVGQIVWAGLFYFFTRATLPTGVAMFGTFATFCLTPLVPIWPAKIKIRIGDSISSTLPDAELESEVLGVLHRETAK